MLFALTAPDVMATVNFRLRPEYHGVPPDTVMDMRGRGAGFIANNGNVMKGEAQKTKRTGKGRSKTK